jgi:hypothetical protein
MSSRKLFSIFSNSYTITFSSFDHTIPVPMPYMIGKTEEVEKGLYLRQFGVPYEAIAYVMGKDPMYWYRASLALGRPSLVGTTVKDGETIPPSAISR